MSFEQPVSAAEADLERLLAVEPSAGFRARVRERVAAGVDAGAAVVVDAGAGEGGCARHRSCGAADPDSQS